jgi:hypothetical protein
MTDVVIEKPAHQRGAQVSPDAPKARVAEVVTSAR